MIMVTKLNRFLFALVALVGVSVAPLAEGSIVGNYLNFGDRNEIRDDSVGVTLTSDGSGGWTLGNLASPQVGDLLLGMYAVNNILSTNGPDNNVGGQGTSVWGIYAFELADIFVNANNRVILDYAPITSGDYTMANILSELGLAVPSTMKAGTMDDAVVAIVETNSVASLPNFDGEFISTLQSVIDGSWAASMVLGIVEPTDYHRVRAPDSDDFSTPYSLAYSVVADSFGPLVYYDQTVSSNIGNFNGGLATGEFVAEANTIITLGSPASPLNNWQFSDKGDFALSPVLIPEPSGIVVWCLGLMVAGLAFRRRSVATV